MNAVSHLQVMGIGAETADRHFPRRRRRNLENQIELDGHELALSKPYERNIGMVFQNYALFPHMTAAKNVVFPLKMRRFPKKDMHARVERMPPKRARCPDMIRRRASSSTSMLQLPCSNVPPRRIPSRRGIM